MKTTDDLRQAQRPAPPSETRSPVAGVVMVLVVLAAFLFVTLYVQRSHLENNRRVMTPEAPVVTTPTTLAPPALANARATPDFEAVVRSIVAYESWLRLHPDPARVTDYMDPTHPGYAEAVAAQRRLASGEVRYDPAPADITVAVARVTTAEPTVATVFVRFNDLPAFRVVDRSGAVVVDTPAKPGNSVAWKLRYSDGRWRVQGFTAL